MARWLSILLLSLTLWARPALAWHDSDEALIPQLIHALADANIRQGASVALAKQGPAAVAALRKSLTSGNPDLRVWSAFTLGEIGPAANSAVADLTETLTDTDLAIRGAAAEALGKMAAVSAVDALANALSDENLNVRLRAAVALGRIGPPSAPATHKLISVLSDHNVRPVARKTLIRIGKSTVNVLVDAVGEDNVRFDILVVLRKVDPAKAMQMGVEKPTPADLPSLQLVLNDTTRPKEDRESAATSLAALGQAGFDELIKAFEHTESARTAAAAFSQADPSAVPQLVVSLKHKEPKVRATTADAIGHLGPTAGDAAAELIRMLKDRDRDVRYHAVRALHELGHAAQPAISALTAVILDSKELEPTRQWALKTLVVTLPDTREMVVKSLIEANSEEINYGVKQLARQLLLKVAPSEAKAAGIK